VDDARKHQCGAQEREEADAFVEKDGRGLRTKNSLGAHDYCGVGGGCVAQRKGLEPEGQRG
jgi:hypothetical protein